MTRFDSRRLFASRLLTTVEGAVISLNNVPRESIFSLCDRDAVQFILDESSFVYYYCDVLLSERRSLE